MTTKTNSASEHLITLRPDIIGAMLPRNGKEQRELFLAGTIRNPHHSYDKLAHDYATPMKTIVETGEQVTEEIGPESKHRAIYDETIETYVDTNELMYFMNEYNQTIDPVKKQQYRDEIMKLNIELHGAPVEREYHHVLASYLDKIDVKDLTGRALVVYQELLGALPIADTLEDPGGYAPKLETMAWMHQMVETLYGGMLAHVENNRTYNPKQLRDLFEQVMSNEFEDAATGWEVVIEPAKSIVVKARDKKIVIPEDRDEVTSEQAKDLIVHEIGVHMLRALYGYDSDVAPLAVGLTGAGDSEEGLAMVTQQARVGTYVEAGHGLYLVASLAHFEQTDFRDTFELMWRIGALAACKDGMLNDVQIEKARGTAYALCMRIFRGTDDIPWFKDLQYYNGTANVWKQLDAICGDDFQYQLMLIGKTDVTNPLHRRTVLESHSS